MKNSKLRKNLKFRIERFVSLFFTLSLIFAVIFSSFSYQIVFTSNISKADEVESSVSESSGELEKEEDEESEEESAFKEESEKMEKAEEKEDVQEVAVEEKSSENENRVEAEESLTENGLAKEENSTAANEELATQDLDLNVLPETSQNINENRESYWKTCDLTDDEKGIVENKECEECREKIDCEEIKICLVEKITNNNETILENNVVSESNTGDNNLSEDNNVSADPNVVTDSEEEGSESVDGKEDDENDGFGESGIAKSEGAVENSIDSGDAEALINLYNEVNVNIVSENYVSEVLNVDGEYVGDIDLLEKFQTLLENNEVGFSENEEGKLVVVENSNKADLKNIIFSSSNSGNNSIEELKSENGDDAINAGDARAVSNLVNYVNLNIVGNNWLFYTINVFGKWLGDLIIPGEGLLNVPENKTGLLAEVVNENSAIVENEVKSESNTGNNKIDGEGLIETGDAYSNSNVTTIANTNITKNNWFLLMINEMGSWRGRITGWNVENPNQNTYSYDFDIGDSDWQNNYFFNAIYKIYNKNSASVHNSVSSFANSGNNSIENGANGNIATGNASAVSNVFNLVNTNIAGNNWMFGIVNLMGEWEGDAVFAYPELKISISDGKESASPKEETSYTIEYENIGKAGCEEVKIYAGLPEYFSYQSDDFGGGYSSQGRAMVWNLEGLNPGEKKSFSIRGKLAENFPEGETILVANAGITTSTKEIEIENNSSSDETKVFGYFQSNENNYFEYGDIDPEIKITREISPGSVVRRGNFVLHSIIVENEGDTPVYNLTVEDNLSNEAGDLGAYQWPIGEIGKGEKFLIQYQVEIAPFAPLGIYTNRALAFGNDAYGREYESKKATSEIRVIQGLAFKNQVENWENPIPTAQAEEDPIVLGESESCQEWPFWVWLSILGLFLAAISTLMASSGLNLFAKWGGTIVSCGAVFAIWYYFEKCRLYPWYPYAVVAAFILSFFAYLTWLRRKIMIKINYRKKEYLEIGFSC